VKFLPGGVFFRIPFSYRLYRFVSKEDVDTPTCRLVGGREQRDRQSKQALAEVVTNISKWYLPLLVQWTLPPASRFANEPRYPSQPPANFSYLDFLSVTIIHREDGPLGNLKPERQENAEHL